MSFIREGLLHALGFAFGFADHSAVLELNGPTEDFRQLCKVFQNSWTRGECPSIQSVMEIVNPAVQTRFNSYSQDLPRFNRKIRKLFHGTSLRCGILDTLKACNSACGVCRIVNYGFQEPHTSNNWQSRGPGFYLAPKSSTAADYCSGCGNICAVILCDVAAGKRYELKKNNPGFPRPPEGYHSVCSKSKFLGSVGEPNAEEYVLYNPDALWPRYVFLFSF